MKFKFISGNLCLDFINTVGEHLAAKQNDYFKSYEDLLSWAVAAEVYSEAEKEHLSKIAALEPAQADQALKKAVKLREILFKMLLAVTSKEDYPANLTEEFNNYLGEALKHLRLKETDGDFSFDWKDSKDNLEQIIRVVAWSAANLLVSGNLEALKLCADNTCGWLFLDTSKNKKRTWCDMKDCGNRNKFRRFYSKNKAEN